MISAVDLVKGLGVYAGMDIIEVEGATGLYDTNYEGKADAALKALEDHDLVSEQRELMRRGETGRESERGQSAALPQHRQTYVPRAGTHGHADSHLAGPLSDRVRHRSVHAHTGQNEGYEPRFTQPVMYRQIDKRPTVRVSYMENLVAQGELTEEEAEVAVSVPASWASADISKLPVTL